MESGKKNGALAQLGERLLCKQDVVGSIPSGSTILLVEFGDHRRSLSVHMCESKETKFADLDPRGLDWRIFRHCKEMAFCSV